MKFKTLERIVNGLTIITILIALSITGLSLKESTKKYVPIAAGSAATSVIALGTAVLYGIKNGIDKNYKVKQDYQKNII
jgi:NADH:ubiquinone oxidoreductase subunit 2 (subunit N)